MLEATRLMCNGVNVFSLDIETIPNEYLIGSLPEPEVKFGNIKDAKKIEEKRQLAIQSQLGKMGLRPETGMICSFAAYGNGIQECKVIDSISYSAEISIIKEIFDLLNDDILVVTHNGMDFDFPYIFKRAMINNIDMSDYNFCLRKFTQRYSITPHFDTLQVWNNWSYDKTGTSLDRLGILLLGEGKTERSYSEYADLIKNGKQNVIAEDNLCDAKITFRLFKKMNSYLYQSGDL